MRRRPSSRLPQRTTRHCVASGEVERRADDLETLASDPELRADEK
jgi:hypothetical protein